MNMKCFLYARKSSEDDDKQMQSIDDQKDYLMDVAKKRGLNIVEIFEESYSAKKPGRPIFNKMIERISNGEVDAILTWKLDRLARNPVDGGSIIWMFQNGIIKKIITSGGDFNTGDNVLMMNIEFGSANQFILDLSRNTKRGIHSKCRKGWRPGVTPLGYINNKEKYKGEKDILKDPERFDLVRKMWDLMITGAYTPEKIMIKANEEWGMTMPKRRKSGGGKLKRSTVYSIFKNPFYYGEFDFGGETYQGKHEPMITKEEFDIVQKILGRKGNSRPSKKEFAYTGVMKCGECGCMITAENKPKYIKKDKKIKSFIYYHCTHKKNKKLVKKCKQRSIEEKELEIQFNEFLDSIEVSEKFLDWAKKYLYIALGKETLDRRKIENNLSKKIKNTAKKLDNLIKLKISGDDFLTDEEFKKQKEEIIIERDKAKSELDRINKRQEDWIDIANKAFVFCSKAKDKFESGTFDEKKEILNCIGSKLLLKDKKLSIEAKGVFKAISKNFGTKVLEMKKLEPSESLEHAEKVHFNILNPKWLPGSDSNRRPIG